jgi:hypothetical protein
MGFRFRADYLLRIARRHISHVQLPGTNIGQEWGLTSSVFPIPAQFTNPPSAAPVSFVHATVRSTAPCTSSCFVMSVLIKTERWSCEEDKLPSSGGVKSRMATNALALIRSCVVASPNPEELDRYLGEHTRVTSLCSPARHDESPSVDLHIPYTRLGESTVL